MRGVSLFSLLVLGLVFSLNIQSVFAKPAKVKASPVDTDGPRCDRTVSRDTLNEKDKAALAEGKMVTHFYNVKGYAMGYVFSEAPFDSELVMGVYSSAEEHSTKLGGFIKKSKVITPNMPKRVFRVEYQQQVDWPYDDSRYTVENTMSADGHNYLLTSRLLESSGADFSPKWADSYFRVTQMVDGKAFVIACSYMVARDAGSFRDTFNSTTMSRVTAAGKNLMQWLTEVSKDAAVAQGYREKLAKAMSSSRR